MPVNSIACCRFYLLYNSPSSFDKLQIIVLSRIIACTYVSGCEHFKIAILSVSRGFCIALLHVSVYFSMWICNYI
jgi:hypothetical protein